MISATLLLLSTPPLFTGLEFQEPPESVVPEAAVADDGDYLVLNFDETEEGGLTLRQFVKVCQHNTGLNFTYDTQTKTTLDSIKILLYGEKRIRKSDFYSFFQIMLKVNGFVCIPQGSGDLAVILIAQEATAIAKIKEGMLFVDVEDLQDFASQPGTYVTTVIRLRWADASDLTNNLRTAFQAGRGATGDSFAPLAQESAILIQGYGPFVAAAARMIQRLDTEPDRPKAEFRKIPLQEASAEELADLLTQIMEDLSSAGISEGGGRRGGPARPQIASSANSGIEVKILANTRDNSLIVTAAPADMERILDLIAELDTIIEEPETNYRIYQLQNIDAEELADELEQFLSRAHQEEQSQATRSGSSGSVAAQNLQKTIVKAQVSTNSLLIMATRTKWAEIEKLLDQLDIRQKQVLIETALIEVSEDFTRELGFELAAMDSENRPFGFTSFGMSELVDALDEDGNEGSDGFIDTRVLATDGDYSGLTAGILSGDKFGIPMLLKAARSSSNANILSKPSILVSNNQGASVVSLDEIPVSTQSAVQGAGISTGFSEYQTAGITLHISPSISANHYLRLYIHLSISSFRGAGSGDLPPPKVTRELETTVHLPDGATMVIGGIVRDDLLEDKQGIPWLSDLPLIGFLFRKDTNSNAKTTLFFFCTPRILHPEDEFEGLGDLSDKAKGRAAEIIGLDRVQVVDPTYNVQDPADFILEGPQGEAQGTLNLSSFENPAFVSTQGEVSPEHVGVDSGDLFEKSLENSPGESSTLEIPLGRNLPEGAEEGSLSSGSGR